MNERVNDDSLSFGVSNVWLVDLATRKAVRWTKEGMQEVRELQAENPEIVVPVHALFEV